MLYTFYDDQTKNDFSIYKHGGDWMHIEGAMSKLDCLKELGKYLEALPNGQ